MSAIITTTVILTTIVSYVAQKFLDQAIKEEGYGRLKKLLFPSKQYKNRLVQVIYLTIEEYEKKQPAPQNSLGIPFYHSEVLFQKLCGHVFLKTTPTTDVFSELQNHPNVITPTSEQLNQFFQIFYDNVKKDKQLKKLYLNENYQAITLDLAINIERVENKIDYSIDQNEKNFNEVKEILKSDGKLQLEWTNQIEVYRDLLNEFKPKTALKLVEALDERLRDSEFSASAILQSGIAYLKGLCLEQIGGKADDSYRSFIRSHELNLSNSLYQEKGCVSYYMIEEFEKAQALVIKILETDSLNASAHAISTLLRIDDFAKVIQSVPKSVLETLEFNRILYVNIRDKGNIEPLRLIYPGLVLENKKLKLFDLSYQNFRNNTYITEIALTRFLREFKILFPADSYTDNEILMNTHEVLSEFMGSIRNAEIKDRFAQIEFFQYFTSHLISSDSSDTHLHSLQKIFNQLEKKDELLGLIVANVLQQSDKSNEAILILKNLDQQSQNVLSLMLFCYTKLEDINSFISIANRKINLFETINASVAEEVLRITGYLGIQKRASELELNGLLSKNSDNDDLNEFISIYLNLYSNGPQVQYLERINTLKESLSTESVDLSNYIQDAYFANGNFQECAATIALRGSKLNSPFEISNYINSLYQLKSNNIELLKWLEYWRNNFPFDPRFVRIEIEKRAFISDWLNCEAICKYAIDNEKHEDFVLYLGLSLYHNNVRENLTDYLEIFTNYDYQKADVALRIVNILLHFKFSQEGLDLCYHWAKEKDNKQARTLFFMSFIQTPMEFFVNLDTVEEKSYVRYCINDNAQVFTKEIIDDSFSKQLLGRKSGDEIEIKRNVGNQIDTIHIKLICNKYLALKLEIIDETENPQSGLGMQSFSFDDRSPMEVINEIAGNSGDTREDPYENYYSEKIKFSEIAFYSPELSENHIKTFFKLIHEKNGILKMIPTAFPIFDSSKTYEFILDFTSLTHFFMLSREGKFIFRDKFKISSFIIVLINSYNNERFGVHHKDYTIDSDFYAELIEWIKSHCDVINPVSLLDMVGQSKIEKKIDNNLTLYLLNQVAMIQEFPTSVLVTDDLFFYSMYPLDQEKLMSTDIYLLFDVLKQNGF